MTANIQVPADLWDGDEGAVLSRWLYGDGSLIARGEVVAELMVEKISFEVLAPDEGTLRILVAEEALVAKGMILGTVR